MIWGAVIVAAGRGTRFGQPKQFVELAGLPMVGWSLRTFARMPEIAEIVAVTEEEWIEPMRALLEHLAPLCATRVVAGGTTRQRSARIGLHALGESCAAALIHDGARPLVRASDVRAGMAEVRSGRGAALGAPVVDTIKVIDPATMLVQRTLDRASLWAAATPQFAMRSDFLRAHADAAKFEIGATDDVALLERLGLDVVLVPSSGPNFKVTLPDDVVRAETLLREREAALAPDDETLLVEVFADDALADAICAELESRGGSIDAIERDLPSGIAVRARVPAQGLRGFGSRFEAFSDGSATFTARASAR